MFIRIVTEWKKSVKPVNLRYFKVYVNILYIYIYIYLYIYTYIDVLDCMRGLVY